MASTSGFDPRQKPPESIKAIYKHYEKLTVEAIDRDSGIVDFVRGLNSSQKSKISKIRTVTGCTLKYSLSGLGSQEILESDNVLVPVYQHEGLPGKFPNNRWI